MSVASLVFILFAGEVIAPVFVKTEDTELLAVSIAGMKLFALSYLVGWVDAVFSAFFTSIELPVLSLTVSFFWTPVFPIAFLLVLTLFWQFDRV